MKHKPEFCYGNFSRVPDICLESLSKVPKLCLDKIDLSLGNFSRVPQSASVTLIYPRNYRGFRPLCYTLLMDQTNVIKNFFLGCSQGCERPLQNIAEFLEFLQFCLGNLDLPSKLPSISTLMLHPVFALLSMFPENVEY